MPERLKGADCKSAGSGLRWFESSSNHLEQMRPMASNGIYIRFDLLCRFLERWQSGSMHQF